MALSPISPSTDFDFGGEMASWWPGPPRQTYYEDSVYSYLLRVGVVVGIFLLALLIAYLAH
jgi:hypothetical protein